MKRLLVVGFSLFGACAAPAPPPSAAPHANRESPASVGNSGPASDPGRETLTQDSPRTTARGTTFTAPAGWTITTKGTVTILQPPEGDSRVALVEVTGADASAAVAAAWAAYRPESKRVLKLTTTRPARNGWEEVRSFEYETAPNEQAIVYATTRRHGDGWIATVVEAARPTFLKRYSQVLLVQGSLRPKGYEPESFAGKKANPLDAAHVKLLTDFVEASRTELAVPGVALALVDGGKVVFEGGFGVRELGKASRVDAQTSFSIASLTKSMTTLLLAKLVDEGKLGWDTPVVDVFPKFKLGDADTTSRVLVKHLVCACTGLPRQDLEWTFEFQKMTPKSLMDLLGTTQPTSKFGEVFQYTNLLASAGGYLAGQLVYPDRELGSAYDEAMRTKVFGPLGMNGTTFDVARAERSNPARPHYVDVDGTTRLAKMDLLHSIVPVRPGGGAWSSVHDVAKYVQLELAKGTLPDGKRLVSETNVLARRAPQVRIGETVAYGMGLMVDTKWKVPVVFHDGSLFGYKCQLYFLPDHGVGAVLLTNSDAGWMMLQPFMRRLLEVLFDGKPEAAEDLTGILTVNNQQRAKKRERLVVPADPTSTAPLAQRYSHPALGALTVKKAGTATVFDFGEWSTTMASRKNDDGTISFVTLEYGTDVDMEFLVGAREGKRALIIRDAQHEYAFTEN